MKSPFQFLGSHVSSFFVQIRRMEIQVWSSLNVPPPRERITMDNDGLHNPSKVGYFLGETMALKGIGPICTFRTWLHYKYCLFGDTQPQQLPPEWYAITGIVGISWRANSNLGTSTFWEISWNVHVQCSFMRLCNPCKSKPTKVCPLVGSGILC